MKLAFWLKVAAEVPLGLMTTASILLGIGTMVGGDLGGIWSLIGAAFFGLLMVLAWQQPRFMGMMLMLFSFMLWAISRGILDSNSPDERFGALIISIAVFITSSLLIISGWRTYNS